MARPGQTTLTSPRSRIRLYLLDHPGPQTAVAIAAAHGINDTPGRQVYSKECDRMYRQGKLDRHKIPNPLAGQPHQRPMTSGYTLPGQAA